MSANNQDIVGIRKTLLSFMLIVVTLPFVTRMLVEAWETRQLVFQAVVAFAALTPSWLTVSAVAMLFTGVFVGLVVVFALDEYKRVQRLLLATAVPLFVGTLWLLGFWTAIDPVSNAWAFGTGAAVGGIVGLTGGRLPKNRGLRTFPRAAQAVYAAVCAVVLVGFLERHLRYGSPVVVEPPNQTGSVSMGLIESVSVVADLWSILYAVSGVGLIIVVSLFVNYANRHDVAILTPPGDSDALAVQFLGDLYQTAKSSSYEAVKTIGKRGGVITEAGTVDPENIPGIDAIRSGVGFQFVPNGLLTQRMEISYTGVRAPSSERLEKLEQRVDAKHGAARLERLFDTVQNGLPFVPRSSSSPNSNRRTDQIDAADTIILLLPSTDLFPSGDGGRLVQQTEPVDDSDDESDHHITGGSADYIDRYRRIYDMYVEDSTHDVVFVLTEADRTTQAFEQAKGYRPVGITTEFVTFVGDRLSTTIDERDVFLYDADWEREKIHTELKKFLSKI